MEEQQVLVKAWHTLTARMQGKRRFKTDPELVNERSREQNVTSHALNLLIPNQNHNIRQKERVKSHATTVIRDHGKAIE